MTAMGVMVVCDVTRENTFEAVRNWKREIDDWSQTERQRPLPVVLLANKVGMPVNSLVWLP